MTRRQISARAFDAEHKRLMLAYRNARGGEKSKTLKALQAHVLASLKAEQGRRAR